MMKITKVGFTGTQVGMSEAQKLQLLNFLEELVPEEFHHGECIGADAEAHNIARWLIPGIKVFGHPPVLQRKRANLSDYFFEFEPKDYLTRNRDIVDCTEMLIVAPRNHLQEEIRSGTWMTKRYAIKQKKHCIILVR